ncbi:glycosyltransferase family 2 protein [Saccharicrinis aurantiacus]|uniref:glycosyltransferase family 2 protein n=1 Tax=Saccharicrinis aurantiacus TaxID=1849719 RepID=UPI0024922BC7|nr:glycosyltransferase [Saccharicrinis aurantiacus]
MLSICLPVYNVDVRAITNKLMVQAIECKIEFEIRIYDDGSTQNYKQVNHTLGNNKNIIYHELPQNLGSAAIRNKLLADAAYNNILFLDSDSDIQDDYIQKYIPHLSQKNLIVCGGRVHPSKLPSSEFSLRWIVGKKREDHSAALRNKVPNKSFMSNNFLVKKELFNTVAFNESIKRSGHEDTMYGIELEKNGINIVHIDNPVTHIGLETNNEFITKTKQRLETLYYLESINKDELIYKRITLLKAHQKLKRCHGTFIFSALYKTLGSSIEKNLASKKPSMFLYDIYKLAYYSTLNN